MTQLSVEAGSDLDQDLTKAEMTGGAIELKHGDRVYLLRLISVGGTLTDEERAWRKALVERTRAHRDRQPPLGISSDQLVRETRAEHYGE